MLVVPSDRVLTDFPMRVKRTHIFAKVESRLVDEPKDKLLHFYTILFDQNAYRVLCCLSWWIESFLLSVETKERYFAGPVEAKKRHLAEPLVCFLCNLCLPTLGGFSRRSCQHSRQSQGDLSYAFDSAFFRHCCYLCLPSHTL